jgi:hypothetical protein
LVNEATELHPAPPRCGYCHQDIPKRPRQKHSTWLGLKFCNREHYLASRIPDDLLVEELELLRGTDTPERICERLGFQPTYLAKRLYGLHRADLAKLLTG